MAEHIKFICPECKHVETKKTRDLLKDILATGLGIGGIFFWTIGIAILAKPALAGRVASVVSSFILNNVAGYEFDEYLRGVAVAQTIECEGNDYCSVEKLVEFVHSNITYVGDSVGELYMSPKDVLESGTSDCSGMAVLYTSLARQIGIPTRVVTEMKEGRVGHAFAISESVYGDVFIVDPTVGFFELVFDE